MKQEKVQASGLVLDNKSGVLGLCRSVESFMSQIKDRVGGKFSYCLFLNPVNNVRDATYLRFGNDIPRRNNLLTVPFVVHPSFVTSYLINLVDISVG